MMFFRKLAHLIPSVRRRAERDMRDELDALREMAGPGALGNMTLAAEDARAEMTWMFLERLAQDVRYGLRSMARDKMFALAAIASLALGIGANTAIYSFLDSVVLRPLPVADPDALVVMKWRAKDYALASHGMSWSTGGSHEETSSIFPYPALALFQRQTGALSNAFGYFVNRQLTVALASETESLLGHYVSGNYFDGIGVVPIAGRPIQPADDRPESPSVTVVSYGFAMRHFGSTTAAVGQTIRVENHPHTIVGVAPEQFFGAEPGAVPDVYLPLAASEFRSKYRDDDHFYWLEVMGRLQPGVTLGQAQAQLSPVFLQYARDSAENEPQKQSLPRLALEEGATGLDSLRRQYAQPIYVLMAMVAVILIVACMNLANLLLARSAARTREIAVRLSLGASRWRIVRQLLTESVMLSAIGGVAGVALASWGIRALTALLANGRDNFTLHARLDWRVLAVTLMLSILTGILFGLAPAMQATRLDVAPALKDDSGREQPTRSRRLGMRGVLVVAQVAFSLLLLVAAGLFDRTLASLRAIPLGFDREHVLLFTIRPSTLGYEGPAAAQVFETLQNRLRQVPGVSDASLSGQPLPAGGGSATRMSIAGTPPDNQRTAMVVSTGPGFFKTMRIPIVAGREFTDRDRKGAPPVVIVSNQLASALGVANPVGRILTRGQERFEIVGVAGNTVTLVQALKAPGWPGAYFSYLQSARISSEMTYEVRAIGDPLSVASRVREAVREIDPGLAIHGMTSETSHINQTIGTEIMLASLCSAFAALALVISCVGLYGTVTFNVARRTREIGIRSALGATGGRLVWMVLRDVLGMAVVGLAIGLPLALAGSRYVKTLLFGVAPNDPVAIAIAMAALLTATLLAGYLPATRAARVDPLRAMRCE